MGRKKRAEEEVQPERSNGCTRKPPVHEVRLGRIRATVWENIDDEQKPWYSVTISRSYKQGDEWRTANSYGRDDLLVAAECLRLAFLFVVAQSTTTPIGQPVRGEEEIPA